MYAIIDTDDSTREKFDLIHRRENCMLHDEIIKVFEATVTAQALNLEVIRDHMHMCSQVAFVNKTTLMVIVSLKQGHNGPRRYLMRTCWYRRIHDRRLFGQA